MAGHEEEHSYDLAIIGGGINGAGIARDAAGRGLKVYLCEANDLASGTSSWSTKLVHGGLRYLEYCEFRLVREALMEREVLWQAAPHIIEPLRFVLPHHKGLRPAWLLRLGLFLYDYIGGRKLLPATRNLDLTTDAAGAPLKPGLFRRGFEYSDCRVDDARLVVLNARDAAARGAVIETRTKAMRATRHADGWALDVAGHGITRTIRTKAIINAAGPWVADVLSNTLGSNAKAKVRLVQGSHIVVPKLFSHDRCYIFQNADGRIIFAIPYEGDFTLIGTTDQDYTGDPAAVIATAEEKAYLCAAASEYFAKPITPADVVWDFSGVRPLYDDGASEAKAATRDYVFDVDVTTPGAPLLSIFGGKITTYRRLAEAVLTKLASAFPQMGGSWTASSPLPGGDFPVQGRVYFVLKLQKAFPFLGIGSAARFIRLYGTEAFTMLDGAETAADLGQDFGSDLTEREVRWLMAKEWAQTAQDVLWRRTKLGLFLSPDQAEEVARFMAKIMAGNEKA